MQPCATDNQPGREGGKRCPAPSAAARGGERSTLARRRSATRRVLTIGRGGGAGVRISGKRLPFCCLLQPRRADLSNSVLYPKRSRNSSSFLKSQRERRQRQRKKKRGGGEGDAHKPSSGRKSFRFLFLWESVDCKLFGTTDSVVYFNFESSLASFNRKGFIKGI